MENYLKQELYDSIKRDTTIFDFIQEGSLDRLWYWDLENPENEWVSNKFWTELGYNPAEMPYQSSTWQDILHLEDLKKANENLEKHIGNSKHPSIQNLENLNKELTTKNEEFTIADNGIGVEEEFFEIFQ